MEAMNDGEDSSQSLDRQLQRLLDIEAIKQTQYRYFRCLDTANLTEMEELLTEDLTTDFAGGTYRLLLSNRAEYLGMIADIYNKDFIGHHNVHHPEIELVSDTEASGTWYLTDLAINLRSGTVTYGTALRKERYRKVEGDWKICHAGYERIYEVEEPLKEPFGLTFHYLGQSGGDEKNG